MKLQHGHSMKNIGNQKGINIAGANIDSTKGLSEENIMIFNQVGDYKGFGIQNIQEI